MTHLNRNLKYSALLITWMGLLAGCASGHTAGQRLAVSEPSSAVFFVELQEKDSRNLASNIAQNLTDRGFEASSGASTERPPGITYLVQYIDHWAWDMRMYLADLRIEVRDVATGAILAYGQSVQNSLKAMGRTHDTVIDLAINEMLGESTVKP